MRNIETAMPFGNVGDVRGLRVLELRGGMTFDGLRCFLARQE